MSVAPRRLWSPCRCGGGANGREIAAVPCGRPGVVGCPQLADGRLVHRSGGLGVAVGARAGRVDGMVRMPQDVIEVARRQDGVVTTGQLLRLGIAGSWVDRRVRDGDWQRLHHGVLLTHSGPALWGNRAMAALLHAGSGAALSHESAAFRHRIRDTPPGVVEVSVPHARRVATSAGVVVTRRRYMPPASGRLPTIAPADTVVDLLARTRDEDRAVGLLCDAVRAGVPPLALVGVVQERAWVPRRALALDLLGAVRDGVESPLEHRYHRDVGRRHRLPVASLQLRHLLDGGWVRADCVYEGLGVRVELDGRLAHPTGRTDRDTWRDNAVVLDYGELTLRYRWRHVLVTPCPTAVQVVRALRTGGWTGEPHPCHPGCPVR